MCCAPADDAFGVLHRPPLCPEAASGSALVPGSASHPDLLPGERGMEIPPHLCQDDWQRFTVSKRSRVRGRRVGPTLWVKVPVLIMVPDGHGQLQTSLVWISCGFIFWALGGDVFCTRYDASLEATYKKNS